MFKPRPKQQEVLEYTSGKMGVAAVPGSGKTATLSYLAAQLVANTDLDEGQEILIVTLVNSAVSNFARQINQYVKHSGLLPGFGYRVRTLHGLANDIVRQKPTVAQLDENFTIVDERESNNILLDAVEVWTKTHPFAPDAYLSDEYVNQLRYRNQKWNEAVLNISQVFIRRAKDDLLSPSMIQEMLDTYDGDLPLVEMCNTIYRDYERGLSYRGAVDFQDLIRLALHVLRQDEQYCRSLQRKWVYILEDEAQDSSKLQEDILRLLVGDNGNWVRVGDPNQAIFETFTTANPAYLRNFIHADDVIARELPNSGRSTRSIQKLANYLIEWSLNHPNDDVRAKTPLTKPFIQPTPEGDPQPNPPDNPSRVFFLPNVQTPAEEARLVINSAGKFTVEYPDQTSAILVPRNVRGSDIVTILREQNIPYVENLSSTSSTREVVQALKQILDYLAHPIASAKLADVYAVWMRDYRADPDVDAGVESTIKTLKAIRKVEDYIAPYAVDWLENNLQDDEQTELRDHLAEFRDVVGQWTRAADLPIDQLILTISGDIFTDVGDIATAYMVASMLRRESDIYPDMRLLEFIEILQEIYAGKRKFAGIGDDDRGFNPDAHKGKVTVTTMHKAKGLEWDRVYLMSVNNYDFPSIDPHDTYIGESWYTRDGLNLSEECLAQLRVLQTGDTYKEGDATSAARVEYVSERLRLLYVGITRARKDLVISWNTGRRQENTEATPLIALRTFWERERNK